VIAYGYDALNTWSNYGIHSIEATLK